MAWQEYEAEEGFLDKQNQVEQTRNQKGCGTAAVTRIEDMRAEVAITNWKWRCEINSQSLVDPVRRSGGPMLRGEIWIALVEASTKVRVLICMKRTQR